MDADNDSELHYMPYKGGTVVLNNDNQYHKLRRLKNGSWIYRCSAYKKSKCPATITIKDGTITKRSLKVHTCERVAGRNAIARELAVLKGKVTQSNKPVTQLYDEACNTFEDTGLPILGIQLPPLSSMQHSLYDMRNKAMGVLKTIYHNFEEVQVPISFEDFILADYYFEGSRILVFCSSECRKLISTIHEFFGDATFKSCPPPFAQLYSIHGDIGSTMETTNVIPLIFALLPNKKENTYSALYNIIKSQLPDWTPRTFHCDFELAAINAITKKFPKIQLKGCFYHWKRAVWRKAKAVGCDKSKGHKRIVGLTAALPLLPFEELQQGWEYIKAESDSLRMEKFTKYVDRFWFRKDFKKILSVFGERHRTNNVLEGWHSKINKRVTKGTITLARLLKLLSDFQKSKINNRTKTKRRTRIAMENDDYIMSIMMKFINAEISVEYTLEMLR